MSIHGSVGQTERRKSMSLVYRWFGPVHRCKPKMDGSYFTNTFRTDTERQWRRKYAFPAIGQRPGNWPVAWLSIQGPGKERTVRLDIRNSGVDSYDVDGHIRVEVCIPY